MKMLSDCTAELITKLAVSHVYPGFEWMGQLAADERVAVDKLLDLIILAIELAYWDIRANVLLDKDV